MARTDNVTKLAYAVVEQAVMDFNKLLRPMGKRNGGVEEMAWRDREIYALMRFFKSEWCGVLLGEKYDQKVLVEELQRKYEKSLYLRQKRALG